MISVKTARTPTLAEAVPSYSAPLKMRFVTIRYTVTPRILQRRLIPDTVDKRMK